MQPQVEYLLLIVVVLVLLGATVGYAWRHRRAPGALHFLAFSGAAWAWTFLVAAMALADPVSARVLLSVKYLAIGLATTSSFLFIAQRTGRLTRLSRWQLAAFFAVPVLGHVASYRGCRDGQQRLVWRGLRAHARRRHLFRPGVLALHWLCLRADPLEHRVPALLATRRGIDGARPGHAAARRGSRPLATNILLITGIAPGPSIPCRSGSPSQASGSGGARSVTESSISSPSRVRCSSTPFTRGSSSSIARGASWTSTSISPRSLVSSLHDSWG
ncbi:MAG: hypothetical protein IPP20_16140 [Gemmatimonadetes bacterium]|nr:hypothetical protein [Gemmatimonadota bacterium]